MFVELLNYITLTASAICLLLDITVFQPWRSKAKDGLGFWLTFLCMALIVGTAHSYRDDPVDVTCGVIGAALMVNLAVLMTRNAIRQIRATLTQPADEAEVDEAAQ